MTNDKVTVYWAPMAETTAGELQDYSIAYSDPKLVYNELKKDISPLTAKSRENLLLCPALKDMFRNTYSFSSTAQANYEILAEQEARSRKEHGIPIKEMRAASITGRAHLGLHLEWIFFSEESLELEITPPYFSDAPHMKDAVIVPGKFDIGSWYRPINAEFILGRDAKEFVIERDEPMFYARFMTDKKVELKRYYMTPELHALSVSCVNHRFTFGHAKPLSKHYETFRMSSLKKKILHHIKKNVVE